MTQRSTVSQLSPANRWWLLVLLALSALGLATVPWDANVPIHWSLHGEADGFAPGWLAVLLPCALGALLLAFLLAIQRIGKDKDREAARHPFEITVSAVLAFFVLFQASILYLGHGGSLEMQRVMVAAAGLMLIVVGNALPKSRPSWQAGLPLRWTKNDPDLWRVTQRWFARAHILSGLLLVALAAVKIQGPLLIVLIVAFALFPTLLAMAIALSSSRARE